MEPLRDFLDTLDTSLAPKRPRAPRVGESHRRAGIAHTKPPDGVVLLAPYKNGYVLIARHL